MLLQGTAPQLTPPQYHAYIYNIAAAPRLTPPAPPRSAPLGASRECALRPAAS